MNLNGFSLISSALVTFLVSSTAFANNMSHEAIAERIAPIGSVYLDGQAPTEEIVVASGPRDASTIYNTFCMACHTTGAAGAPKIGDASAWDQRLAQGRDILNDHAINGFNGMPARGTCMDCSDEEIIATIDFMVKN